LGEIVRRRARCADVGGHAPEITVDLGQRDPIPTEKKTCQPRGPTWRWVEARAWARCVRLQGGPHMAVYQGAHAVLGRAGESLVEWADGGVSA
jgi:hypothetical protein